MSNTDNNSTELIDGMGELDELFGGDDSAAKKSEKIVLNQNLEGFASCFPDWDLHPPVGF